MALKYGIVAIWELLLKLLHVQQCTTNYADATLILQLIKSILHCCVLKKAISCTDIF